MRWYVRNIDSGEVWGPMTKSEADDMVDTVDDMIMFQETLFEPRMMSDDIAQSVHNLCQMAGEMSGTTVGDVCRKAAELLVNLSREKLITGKIQGGVLDFDALPLGVRIKVDDYDVDGVDDDLERDDEDRLYTPLEFVAREG